MCNNIHMGEKYEISFIVPSFNEEENIKLLFDRINEVFKNTPYNVIYIDDGSKDNTFSEIKKLAENHKNVKAVSFSRNFGKEAAIYAGLNRADGKYICLIDADMQQDPIVSLDMINILKKDEDIDCVCAVPRKRKDNPIMICVKNAFYNVINAMCDITFEKNASDFRTFRSCVKDALISLKEYERFSKGLFSWVGFNTTYIEYDVKPRASGKSKWSFAKLLKYALNGIISFSIKPLMLPLFFGVLLLITSLAFVVIKIYNPSFLSAMDGNAFIIVVLLFVGLFFISFGILGLYLSKIYMQNKNRKIYVVKDEIK